MSAELHIEDCVQLMLMVWCIQCKVLLLPDVHGTTQDCPGRLQAAMLLQQKILSTRTFKTDGGLYPRSLH